MKSFKLPAMPINGEHSLYNTILAAQHDEEAAYARLYTHYADRLYRYIYARSGNLIIADELLDKVWLQLVENLPDFHLPQEGTELAFSKWMYHITHDLVLNYYRNLQYKPVSLNESHTSNTLSRHNLVAHQEDRLLDHAFKTLTPEQREVVVLRFLEEHTTAEVAILIERSEDAVKGLQQQVLVALQTTFGSTGAGR